MAKHDHSKGGNPEYPITNTEYPMSKFDPVLPPVGYSVLNIGYSSFY
jgi:hypothetical protein